MLFQLSLDILHNYTKILSKAKARLKKNTLSYDSYNSIHILINFTIYLNFYLPLLLGYSLW